MKRDLSRLSGHFDVLVVGGGIMGLACAREAAQRGLATALVEKGDFGGATSANSLKLIHGGLRYLQHLDIGRLRQSVRERKAFMRTAPHLVYPLPFLVPTYGHGTKSREAMSVAFLLYDLLSPDRNRLPDPGKRIPTGRTVSASECLSLFPGFRREGLTGGAIFCDGQVHNSERLTLSVALGAEREGATLANYARVTGFLTRGGKVVGAQVRDELGGREMEIEAGLVINAAGPWADRLLGSLGARGATSGYLLAKAVNIVTPRPLSPRYAVGVEARAERSDSLVGRGSRLFFITPWRGASLVGTTYHTWREDPDRLRIEEADIMELVDGVNTAWPEANLRREEVSFFHLGCVPITAETSAGGANLAKSDRIIDHAARGGAEGLVSVVGVKYTTARDVAQKTVDLAFRKLARAPSPSRTAGIPLPGGETGVMEEFLAAAQAGRPSALDEGQMRHLALNYGSDFPKVLACGAELLRPVRGSREVLAAEVVHGVREEMAVKLADAVLRRTELGSLGHPGREALEDCAELMARELGWDQGRRARELEEAAGAFTVGR